MGLAGVGDLFLTCSSEKSRNFTVGYRLGKGESLDQVIATLGSTAEGVTTLKAAYLLARKLNVDTPITDHLYGAQINNLCRFNFTRRLLNLETNKSFRYGILYEKKPIREAVEALLRRVASAEY